ncbi:MAG: hypothetical protein M3O15_04170 [Acidobacteriota bacterium]|nr:hypothetical protein [Acidobacteriota bacterium]
MSFQLNVIIEGMIAMVPLDKGRVQLLMVEGRRDMMASDGSCIPKHFPVVRFDKRDLPPGSEASLANSLAAKDSSLQKALFASVPSRDEKSTTPYGYWFLDRQDLGFHYNSQDKPARDLLLWDESTASANANGHGGGEDSYLSWIPRLAKIAPAAAVVDPDCLVGNPEKRLIAARLLLTEGSLMCAGLSQNPATGDRLSVDFRPVGADASAAANGQHVGTGFMFQLKVPSDAVCLTSKPWSGGQEATVLTLSPSDKRDTAVVEVSIWNLPLESIFELGLPQGVKMDMDVHFEMFYELSSRRPPLTDRPIPHLQNQASKLHPIRMSDLFCPPVHLEAPPQG